jgi:predicted CXXCH cytochrome family protein
MAALALALLIPAVSHAADMADSPCYECHDKSKEVFGTGSPHQPVADGDCSACHADHGAENKLVLSKEVPELCWDCHDEMNGAQKHDPVASGNCLDCHSIHTAPNKGLIEKAGGELCAECHDVQEKAVAGNVHSPVADGDCDACHDPHQSAQKPLLLQSYEQSRYAMYEAEKFALCFECHEKSGIEDPADTSTAFRHGSTNLHYLHVAGAEEVNKYGIKKKKAGMTCMGCHSTHGAPQAKLVRVNLECGATFCYTLNFRKFAGGGSCVVGCHKPKVYRNEPTAAAPEPVPQSAAAPASPAPSATP